MSNIGLYGGVYQNRYFSVDSLTSQNEYNSVLSYTSSDSVQYTRVSAARETKITYDNYGFILSVPFTCYKNVTSPLKSFLSITPLDLEIVFRKATYNYTYDVTIRDTFTVSTATLPMPLNTFVETETKQFFDSYWGVVTFQYSGNDNNYSVFLKYTPLGIYWNNMQESAFPYYGFYFGVREKYLGIRIGGEVKGFYGKHEPFLSIFLTKAFDLAKLGEGILSN